MAKSNAHSWRELIGTVSASPLAGTLHRLVESQEQIATMELVGKDHQKQSILEELLDISKPPYLAGTEHLDYLLRSPWRYAPLDYGSRFGSTTEASIFYGGLSRASTLAESAYYRWVFYFDQHREAHRSVTSLHTLFEAKYQCKNGYQLHKPPFDQLDTLRDTRDYRECQSLGTLLRDGGTEVIKYQSARDPEQGLCVALLSPTALHSTKAENLTNWICTTNATMVSFTMNARPAEIYRFSLSDFTDDGTLPQPAS